MFLGSAASLVLTVIRKATREIIKLAEEKELTYGKSPTGITAAALYIAGYQMNQIRTQREISEITNVTEVTIEIGTKDFWRA